jgi:hypothetical protein
VDATPVRQLWRVKRHGRVALLAIASAPWTGTVDMQPLALRHPMLLAATAGEHVLYTIAR